MRPILFLDFDGVLVTHDDWAEAEKLALTVQEEIAAMRLPAVVHRVGMLRSACVLTGADVVVSSTWRSNGVVRCREYLAAAGWADAPVLGVTGAPRPFENRGDEIRRWLESLQCHGSYVIIDDDHDAGSGHRGRLVQCDPSQGFGDKELRRVVEVLGMYDDYYDAEPYREEL